MLRLRIATKDSYLVTTMTESFLHVRHRVLQIIESFLQCLDPHGIDPTIGLEEGDRRFEILNLRHHPLLLLFQLQNLMEKSGTIRIHNQFSHFETIVESLEKLHVHVHHLQVLINTTEDLSGVLHTLAPLLLQSISL